MAVQLLDSKTQAFKNGALDEIRLRQGQFETQDHAAQVEALKAAGCERIFSEKASGKSTNGRPEFAKLMRALKPGDVVTVVKLDSLARSSRDLQNILHELQEMVAALSRSVRAGATPRPTSADW